MAHNPARVVSDEVLRFGRSASPRLGANYMAKDDEEETERLAMEFDQLLEKQRNELGIDEGVRIAGLSPEEDRFIENILLKADPNDSGDRQHIRKILLRLLLAIRNLHKESLNRKYGEEQKQKSYKSNRSFAVQFLLVVGALLAFLTFRHTDITVDPSDGSVFATESSWWGIVTKHRAIKWMTTTDDEGPAWMTKGKDGKWYPYLVENEMIEE
jgi:hypothetical protein